MRGEGYAGFWLVQRLRLSPASLYDKFPKDSPMEKATGTKYNPFGYGRMGDYEADYMGSAEFEFGTLTRANNRMAASTDIRRETHEVSGRQIEFVYPADISPDEYESQDHWRRIPFGIEQFRAWVKDGCPNKDDWSFKRRLEGETDEYLMRTGIWWSLNPLVMWSFPEEGHFDRLFASLMAGEPTVLR